MRPPSFLSKCLGRFGHLNAVRFSLCGTFLRSFYHSFFLTSQVSTLPGQLLNPQFEPAHANCSVWYRYSSRKSPDLTVRGESCQIWFFKPITVFTPGYTLQSVREETASRCSYVLHFCVSSDSCSVFQRSISCGPSSVLVSNVSSSANIGRTRRRPLIPREHVLDLNGVVRRNQPVLPLDLAGHGKLMRF